MSGTSECDELRGYLDVKVPSISRKKGLLINWKAWRKRWLVIRRFLVSSPIDEGAVLGRRIELKLTGDDSSNSAAPCPVLVVEEWQEDALVCSTKSRSHPYAFGLFPQPGCDPVLFLSGRTAEESRRWQASIRSLLVPPFRPCSNQLYSITSCNRGDEDETYQRRHMQRSERLCFPPLPSLPSQCRLRRRSSLESLTAPIFLMDRRRSLSDSELPNNTISKPHHRHKCQNILSKDIEADRERNEYLIEDCGHHIYAGIGDSGVCSSMSNVSRNFLSSSSSSSCSSSSGLYAYATPSSSGFTSYIKGNEFEEVPAEFCTQVALKQDIPSLMTGNVTGSPVTAGIGIMLSTPTHSDGVTDLHISKFEEENTCIEGESSRTLSEKNIDRELDMDRRESIASGIYEEIQEDEFSFEKSKNLLLTHITQKGSNIMASPPPLPPRSPCQCFHPMNGRQQELAWFLGVHRNSNSCPTSDVEDNEPSRESSPVKEKENEVIIRQRKISEPLGMTPVHVQNRPEKTGCSRRRRKNLESFLGVMEFGSKELNKYYNNDLNKSLGALELESTSEKEFLDKKKQIRMRTFTEISRNRLDNVRFHDSLRSSSTGTLLSQNIVSDTRCAKKGRNTTFSQSILKKEYEENEFEKDESKENSMRILPTMISKKIYPCNQFDKEKIERCHSFSCSLQSFEIDSSDKRDHTPKSPRSIAKRIQMMKPNLMKLILKEQTKQQDLSSIKDKTKQVINKSLETLGWLGLATNQFDDSSCNVVVGGSSFYRSATCTGVDFQSERQNALRRGTSKVCKEWKNMEKQIPDKNLSPASYTEGVFKEKLGIESTINLLEDSAICLYHRSQLKKTDCDIGQTLEDLERLAKQELICEQVCNINMENDSHYIPMRPLKKVVDELFCSSNEASIGQNSDYVMPEEEYISMEGISASFEMDNNSCKESFNTVNGSLNSSACMMNDVDIYMPMEDRKSTQDEVAQR